ncbi:DUF1206 domain-containing protein [Jatrophihabitans telluris]|uniref:DUF1206 domain-containing protein n=1 Tax=Jatrophihabitans telluris TaxID=2038343 RepID=A0ABY4QXI2_9ACTN|nr:DUF1206 domain-containing protein [Jatrophihabitans telluris]UQX88208.1 DUF1206 domain-containing protein [Jatrophihabitans telluris]
MSDWMSGSGSRRMTGAAHNAAGSVSDSVRGAAESRGLKRLARLGLAARATIYLLIGWFTLLLAFGHHAPETDQRGAMQELTQHTGGFVLLFVITVGLVGYALWRFSEAAFGVVGQGRDAGPRLQSLARGLVYAFFAVSAVNLLLHSRKQSQAGEQQQLTARVMRHTGGRWAIAIAGLIVIAVGLFLVVEGVRRKFLKYFKLGELSPLAVRAVRILGAIGTTARGIVFALSGIFVVQAAWKYDPHQARGLDGALRKLSESDYGRWWVGLAAVGLIAFALYGYCEAAWRRT